jgi:hypothetical protein
VPLEGSTTVTVGNGPSIGVFLKSLRSVIFSPNAFVKYILYSRTSVSLTTPSIWLGPNFTSALMRWGLGSESWEMVVILQTLHAQ